MILTQKERGAGRLGAAQEYRQPTDAEWDAAVAKTEFPRSSQWPPPKGAGNYADEAARRGRFASWGHTEIIPDYDDGYDATAPVGSFTANRYGLFDPGNHRLAETERHGASVRYTDDLLIFGADRPWLRALRAARRGG